MFNPLAEKLYSDGNDEEKTASIGFLYTEAQKKHQSVIAWYLQRKSDKRVTAQRFRRLAIRLIAIAGQ